MIILIAESKTMQQEEQPVSSSVFESNTPLGEDAADKIIDKYSGLSVTELAELTGLSPSLAVKMQKMIYEFRNKALGLEAIKAFTGVVFKALDFESLGKEAAERCREEVRIISSLYGWLRPGDIIKPFRLDFKSKVPVEEDKDKTLSQYWRQDVTIRLVKCLQTNSINEILNLLPGDASLCIDWKLVKRFAKVWTVDFQEMKEGGVLKTPNAGRLKTMRGTLLRQILQEDIKDVNTLMHVSSPHYYCEGTPVYPDRLRFIC